MYGNFYSIIPLCVTESLVAMLPLVRIEHMDGTYRHRPSVMLTTRNATGEALLCYRPWTHQPLSLTVRS